MSLIAELLDEPLELAFGESKFGNGVVGVDAIDFDWCTSSLASFDRPFETPGTPDGRGKIEGSGLFSFVVRTSGDLAVL